VFSLVDSAVDTTLPAFAAERRAAAPCHSTVLRHRAVAPCCGTVAAGRPAFAAVDRYFFPARRSAANSPHAAAAVE